MGKKKQLKQGMIELYYIAYNSADVSNNFSIIGRIKSKFSRAVNLIRGKTLDDVLATTIVVHSVDECNRILESINKNKKIKVLRKTNYIEKPKQNGYKAIHLKTMLILDDGREVPFEIQIKTKRMLYIAERGSASHDEYKKQIFTHKKDRYNWGEYMGHSPADIISIIRERSSQIELIGEGEDVMTSLSEYADELSLDLGILLDKDSDGRKVIIDRIEDVTEKMRIVSKGTIRVLEDYIKINEMLLENMQSDIKIDEVAIKILQKQWFYFNVCELIKSRKKSIEEIKEEIEAFGPLAAQAFAEICIMLDLPDFEVNEDNIRRVIKSSQVEKFYIVSKKGMLKGKGMVKKRSKVEAMEKILGEEGR